MSYFPLQYKLELMGPDDVCSQLGFLSGILSVVTRREGRSEVVALLASRVMVSCASRYSSLMTAWICSMMLLFFKKAHHHIRLPRPLKRLLASPSDPSSLCSGQGVTVCDKLQCVCDKTTAECMAAAHFNHSLPAPQCHGSTPPCRRASRPPKPLRVSPQSSEESDMEVGDASSEEDTAANTPPPLQPPHR